MDIVGVFSARVDKQDLQVIVIAGKPSGEDTTTGAGSHDDVVEIMSGMVHGALFPRLTIVLCRGVATAGRLASEETSLVRSSSVTAINCRMLCTDDISLQRWSKVGQRAGCRTFYPAERTAGNTSSEINCICSIARLAGMPIQ